MHKVSLVAKKIQRWFKRFTESLKDVATVYRIVGIYYADIQFLLLRKLFTKFKSHHRTPFNIYWNLKNLMIDSQNFAQLTMLKLNQLLQTISGNTFQR